MTADRDMADDWMPSRNVAAGAFVRGWSAREERRDLSCRTRAASPSRAVVISRCSAASTSPARSITPSPWTITGSGSSIVHFPRGSPMPRWPVRGRSRLPLSRRRPRRELRHAASAGNGTRAAPSAPLNRDCDQPQPALPPSRLADRRAACAATTTTHPCRGRSVTCGSVERRGDQRPQGRRLPFRRGPSGRR